MRRLRLISAAVISGCLTLAPTAVAAEASFAASDLVSGHIVPRYEKLEQSTAELARAVQADCRDSMPGDARSILAFKDALIAWQSVQHIRFGPVMKNDRHYRFQYWPDKHGQGARQLRRLFSADQSKIPSAERIGQSSVAIQGFPALERILHSPERNAGLKCALALSIARNLGSMSTAIVQEWSSWQADEDFDVGKELARNLSDQLDAMAELKLARPLGGTLETARPHRAELWRSSLSLAALAANFEGMLGLFAGENGKPGMRALAIAGGSTVRQADQLQEHLEYGATFIGWQKLSLYEAVSDQAAREQVVFLLKHVRYTQDLVKSVVFPALGLVTGFNAQDGD